MTNLSAIQPFAFAPQGRVQPSPTAPIQDPEFKGNDIAVLSNQSIKLDEGGVYEPPVKRSYQHILSSDAPDQLTAQLSRQLEHTQRGRAVNNLSQNMAAFLANGTQSAQQAVNNYEYYDVSGGRQSIDPTTFQANYVQVDASLALEFKTKDGDVVTFKFSQHTANGTAEGATGGVQRRGLEVSYQVEGKLSQSEQEELADFAENLNLLANQYFQGGKFDLGQLNLGELNHLGKLSLSMDRGDKNGVKLKVTDTENSRNIEGVIQGNVLQLSLDKAGFLASADADRRDAAVAHYRQMMLDGVQRAKGQGAQSELLLDAFDALHQLTNKETMYFGTSSKAYEAEMLTGLADFTVEFEGRVQKANTDPRRQNQREQFSLSLAQESDFSVQDSMNRNIEQRQLWSLDASYFKPLDHLDEVDFENQNYQYFTLSEQAETRTQVNTVDGEVTASQERSFNSQFDSREYNEGILVDWQTTLKQEHELLDFTEQLNSDKYSLNPIELRELLLNPTQMNSGAHLKVIDHDVSNGLEG